MLSHINQLNNSLVSASKNSKTTPTTAPTTSPKTVKFETAEAIADITSTGDTLRANHLKILEDGLILRSQATLFQSRSAKLNADDRATLDALRKTLGVY